MSVFSHVLASLQPWIEHYGSAAVFVILTFESLGLPLPGELLLIATAILAGRGEISLPLLLFAAWAGAVIGDNIGYIIGRSLGHRALLRYGGKLGLTVDRLRKVEAVFSRYGPATVGFARFFNILRQLNGVVAGALEMDWRKFLIFNALGGALWVIVWTAVGYYLDTHASDIEAIADKSGFVGLTIVAIALLSVGIFLFVRRQAARRHKK